MKLTEQISAVNNVWVKVAFELCKIKINVPFVIIL